MLDGTSSSGANSRWGLAALVSVVLHVAVISLFVALHEGKETPSVPPDVEQAPAASPSAEQAEKPKEQPVEEKTEPTSLVDRTLAGDSTANEPDDAGKASRPVPPPPPPPPAKVTSPLPERTRSEAATKEASYRTYVVQKGDSLTRLAKESGCSVADLAKLNKLKPSAGLRLGQKLKLPAKTD